MQHIVCCSFLGNKKQTQVMDNFIQKLPQTVHVVGMTGSLIGKRGLKDGLIAQALLRLSVQKGPEIQWSVAWRRYEALHC